MDRESFKDLLQRYAAEQSTPEENKELERYLIKNSITEKAKWKSDTHKEVTKNRMRNYIFDQIGNKSSNKERNLIRWLSIAASFIILVGISIFFHQRLTFEDKGPLVIANSITESFQDVTISTSSGGVKVLNDVKVLDLRGAKLDGKISDGKTILNTIHVPSQHQFSLILVDGTKVWLNAGSKLTYPSQFSARDRTVDLQGEAYFEVAKNSSKPFKVNVRNSQIKVTGTKFNIVAYDSESNVTTSLVEGGVNFKIGANEYPLKPGFEIIADQYSETIKTGVFDQDQVLAWKNGYFVFNNMELVSVMKHVARWYNITVTAPLKKSNKQIEGTFPISASIDDLLRDLQTLSGVKFERKGKEVKLIY